jgi:hypothetical protein
MADSNLARARLLVEAQSLKHGSAHLDAAALSFMRPLSELDFRHQFRLHVVHAAIALHLTEEGIAAGFKRVQALPHLGVSLFRESAARLADRNQAAFVVVQSQHNRTKVFA